jgi:hypothetical protein
LYLVASSVVNEGVDNVPKDAEDQVAVDDEEGLQAFGVIVLLVVGRKRAGRDGGKEGVSYIRSTRGDTSLSHPSHILYTSPRLFPTYQQHTFIMEIIPGLAVASAASKLR